MQKRMTGNEYRTTIVCLDSCEKDVPCGRLFNSYVKGGIPFESLMQFLVLMENLLDEMQFPQPFFAKREFAPLPKPEIIGRAGEINQGRLATFALRVLFRQNASWQGSVIWLETGQEESFRSVLELLLLMRSAISGGEAKKAAPGHPNEPEVSETTSNQRDNKN